MTSAITQLEQRKAQQVPLTRREAEILRYLPTRLSNAEIGGALGISQNTVKTHLKGVYRKLGVATRNDAIQAAVATGLLTPTPAPQSYQAARYQ